jgi:hypothetical protein
MNYGGEIPDVEDRNVYVLDFSFPRGTMIGLAAQAKSFLCLDHHETAQAACEGLSFCRFDLNKSGARLTWEYFFGEQDAPGIVVYTEDRDLWRWSVPGSKAVNANLRTYPLDFALWDDKFGSLSTIGLLEELADGGDAILRAEAALIAQHVRNAHEIEIDGHLVLCVNATCLVSEIAGELAKDRPFGVVWFEGDNNERVYSLRSREGGINVAEIAKAHGGGGHKNAAGFRAPATGATGLFTQGQASDDDEGGLTMAFAADRLAGIVRVEFGKPVAWLGLPKDQAQQFAAMVARKASELP